MCNQQDRRTPEASDLLPCPFCCGAMEDRGYGAIHADDSADCPLVGYAFALNAWNTRTPAPQGEAQPLVICEEKTARGFAKVAFSDHYGVACSIQKSSLATEEAIWIGTDDLGLQRFASDYTGWHDVDLNEVFPGQTISANTRMHLTQDDVGALLPLLVHFAQTGQVLARCAHPSAAPVIAGAVKQLVWVRDPDNAGDDWFSRAWADVYCYEVGQDDGPEATWWWQEDAVTSMAAVSGFSSENAAKAAAQADFATRILSQIEGQV